MDRRAFLAACLAAGGVALVPGRALAAGVRSALPRPTAALVSAWDRDPWARGAYSALPPGVDPGVRSILGDALLGGRVVLAGEYASDSFPATTTGAEQSGRAAARLLAGEVRPRSVVVIGAGIAGAAAAHALAASGAAVTVLEARDRVGGRLWSDMSWGVPVEMGAAWIHGTTGNPITSLAAASGLRLVPTDYEDEQVRDTVTGRVSAGGSAAQDRMSAWVDQIGGGDGPTRQSVAQALSRRGWRADRCGTWAAEVVVTQEYGLGPAALGVRALQEGQEMQGPDALVAGGYARIVSSLLQGIDVRLSTPVSSVRVSGGSVTVAPASGAPVTADAAVVAVPLALLQQRAITVDPMPADVSAALAGLRTGDLEKVVLRYDRAWWDDYSVFGIVGGGAPGAPAGSLAALRWTEFYPLTDVLGFPALVGFSGGSAAMARPASPQAIAAEAVAALDAAFTRH